MLLTLEYAVRVIFIHLDIPQLSPLEDTEKGTALIHHVRGTLSCFSLVQKNVQIPQSFVHLFTHLFSPSSSPSPR